MTQRRRRALLMMRWFKRKEHDTAAREAEAADRWRQHNAERQAAGCRCGRPATQRRSFGGTVGGVPAEVWSCAQHVNVNSWSSNDGGKTWEAGGEFDEAALAWQTR